MSEPLLNVSGLAIEIERQELVSNVDLSVDAGATLGIVGESGSGKSVTCRALTGTLAAIGGVITRGEATLDGHDLLRLGPRGWSSLYGRVVSLVPQNSLSALNPLMRIDKQLTETIAVLAPADPPEDRARELLVRVGLRDIDRVMRQYPHELSGGMRQRVMIALAIAGRPRLLVADEPTTALDVTIQAAILRLLRELVEEEGMALILVSHDFGVVGAAADAIAVMYAGNVVERGPTQEVLRRPKHPYAKALLDARPRLGSKDRLRGIPGAPASPDQWLPGCRFRPRCPHATVACRDGVALRQVGGEAWVACCHWPEIETSVAKKEWT